jgi:hypothetical protein
VGNDSKQDPKRGLVLNDGKFIKAESLAENSVGIRIEVPCLGTAWIYLTTAEAEIHLKALTGALAASMNPKQATAQKRLLDSMTQANAIYDGCIVEDP